MGVLTDLVVAPLSDAELVASTPSNERSWPFEDVKGLDTFDLAIISCLLEGQDPDLEIAPPVTVLNPFTKKPMERKTTAFTRALKTFATVANVDEVLVEQVPADLVAKLAKLEGVTFTDVTRQWSAKASAEKYGDGRAVPPFPESLAADYLAIIIRMAKTAEVNGHSLLIWTCP